MKFTLAVLAAAAPAIVAACDASAMISEALESKTMNCVADAATSFTDVTGCDYYEAYSACFSQECCEWYVDSISLLCADLDAATVCSGGGGVCFPATAEVELADGSKKTMDKVQVGDKVLVGEGSYSEVYFFTTAMKETTTSFVEITAGDNKLALTAGHYLYVNGELTKAGRVIVGDVVTLADGSSAKVSAVGSKWGPGLYNPHTMDGDIVVDGVKTSTYTEAVHPTLAHALLFPVRKMYEAGVEFGEKFSTTAKNMPSSVMSLISA
jgi:hypothetical protein